MTRDGYCYISAMIPLVAREIFPPVTALWVVEGERKGGGEKENDGPIYFWLWPWPMTDYPNGMWSSAESGSQSL